MNQSTRQEQLKNIPDPENQLKLDVYQTINEIVIKSAIAGVEQRDIEIDITNDILTIKGAVNKDETVKAEAYYYKECHWGPFSRSVILPSDIDTTGIRAMLKNGVLTIRLPKSGKIQTQKIKIQSE